MFKEKFKSNHIIVLVYEMIAGTINKMRKYSHDKREYSKIRQKKVSWGKEYPDKTFYILRSTAEFNGIYTIISEFLPELEFVEQKGYIPVVDLSSVNLKNLSQDYNDTNNKWDYFFEPMEPHYSLESIRKSKNVILGWMNGLALKNYTDIVNFNDDLEPEYLKERFSHIFNKYIRLNDELSQRVDSFYNKYMLGRRILGVEIRESYRWHSLQNHEMIKGHAMQSSPYIIADKVSDLIKKYNCDAVFIISDDKTSVEIFKDRFKGKLIYVDRNRPEFFDNNGNPNSQQYIQEQHKKSDSSGMTLTKDYLTEVELLSRCQILLSSRATAGRFATIRNNNSFEEIIYNGNDIY